MFNCTSQFVITASKCPIHTTNLGNPGLIQSFGDSSPRWGSPRTPRSGKHGHGKGGASRVAGSYHQQGSRDSSLTQLSSYNQLPARTICRGQAPQWPAGLLLDPPLKHHRRIRCAPPHHQLMTVGFRCQRESTSCSNLSTDTSIARSSV